MFRRQLHVWTELHVLEQPWQLPVYVWAGLRQLSAGRQGLLRWAKEKGNAKSRFCVMTQTSETHRIEHLTQFLLLHPTYQRWWMNWGSPPSWYITFTFVWSAKNQKIPPVVWHRPWMGQDGKQFQKSMFCIRIYIRLINTSPHSEKSIHAFLVFPCRYWRMLRIRLSMRRQLCLP